MLVWGSAMLLRALRSGPTCMQPRSAIHVQAALQGPATVASDAGMAGTSPLQPALQAAPSPQSQPKADLVAQFLSQHNHREAMALRKQELLKQFQRHPSDTGSPEVTVALWTEWIREQVKTFYRHTRHHQALLGMEKILHKRRRLLSYLRESDFKAYSVCISNLGLADVFGVSTTNDRYPVGKAHKDPAGAADRVIRKRFPHHPQFKIKKTSQWKRILPVLQAQDPQLPPAPAQSIAGSVQRRVPLLVPAAAAGAAKPL